MDATYDGCKAINIQEAANKTDLLTYASACCEISLKKKKIMSKYDNSLPHKVPNSGNIYPDMEYLDPIISRRAGARADASGCMAMHFIQTPSMYINLPRTTKSRLSRSTPCLLLSYPCITGSINAAAYKGNLFFEISAKQC
jgi:hypothetical protein